MADEIKKLEAQLAELRSQNEKLLAQNEALSKASSEVATSPSRPWPKSLIITRGQLESLGDKDREEFRKLGGTVTEDPVEEKK
jgi:hypothetical protein